jgi:hypothetical protein
MGGFAVLGVQQRDGSRDIVAPIAWPALSAS